MTTRGYIRAFPVGSVVMSLPANIGDVRDIVGLPGLGRSPREENGNLLECSYLQNSMCREVWQATVHGIAESDRTERVNLCEKALKITEKRGEAKSKGKQKNNSRRTSHYALLTMLKPCTVLLIKKM